MRELFDPLNGANIEDQKLGSMRRICGLLRQKQVEPAVRLFRETRNVLSGLDEENTFGEFDILPEDELLALNAIMMTDFPEEEKKKNVQGADGDEDGGDEEEEEEEENAVHVKEATFTIEDTVKKYAHPNVLRAYRLILKNFRANSVLTNHSIVRMFARVAVDLKMPPMFYNFGFFLVFEKILSDPVLKLKSSSSASASAAPTETSSSTEKTHNSVIKELGEFAHFITRKFFKLLAKYPNVASELCFCANTRDAYSMELGWAEVKQEKTKKGRKAENGDDEPEEPVLENIDEDEEAEKEIEDEEEEEEEKVLQVKKKRKIESLDDDQEESTPSSKDYIDEEKDEDEEQNVSQIKRKRMKIFDDDQEEESASASKENATEEEDEEEQSIAQVKKRRVLILDDEQEESAPISLENIEVVVEEEESIVKIKKKRATVLDDDEPIENVVLTSMENIDEDEVEEEEEFGISQVKKKRVLIFDDDDE